MRTSWMVAVGMAVVLIGAGVARAKHDGDPGEHGRGHGKGHDSGKSQGSDGGDAHGNKGNGGAKHGGPGGKGGGPGSSACDTASSTIGAFVDATCPCAGANDGNGGTVAWKNHGQYVRCVSHAVRDASRAAGVKRRCAKGLVPCAARSTCGKKNAVACFVATTGTCTNGLCSNDDDMPCVADADCTTAACGVTSADDCTAAGGVAGTGSCCTASPSGAFLD